MAAVSALSVVLLFVLMVKAANMLAAVAWSFLAGAVWSQFDSGKKLGQRSRPVAVSVLWACAMLPFLLQTHGRTLAGISLLSFAGLVIVALALKYFAIRIALWMSGLRAPDVRSLAFLNLPSGESAVLVLGFGVTRWNLDGPLYFSVLVFALASMIVGPVIARWVKPQRPAGAYRVMKVFLLLVGLSMGLASLRLEAATDNIVPPPATEAVYNSTIIR